MRIEIIIDLLNGPDQFLIATSALIACWECAVQGSSPRDNMIVTNLSDAAIATANCIDRNIRVRYWWHSHIVEVINWNKKLDIVQFYLLPIDVSLIIWALRWSRLFFRAFIRYIFLLMGTVLIVRNREALWWIDLLLSDNLPNDILYISFVEILNEELVWLDLVLEADWSIFGRCVN